MSNRLVAKAERADKRRRRVRSRIIGTSEVPRLSVARSLKHIYVQIIDDVKQVTLVGVGTTSKAMAGKFDQKENKTARAKKIGEAIAELALAKGITQVVFDRNRFRYHGRVKALADGARAKGLKF
jgi:large subunit ribosomal protein L18